MHMHYLGQVCHKLHSIFYENRRIYLRHQPNVFRWIWINIIRFFVNPMQITLEDSFKIINSTESETARGYRERLTTHRQRQLRQRQMWVVLGDDWSVCTLVSLSCAQTAGTCSCARCSGLHCQSVLVDMLFVRMFDRAMRFNWCVRIWWCPLHPAIAYLW